MVENYPDYTLSEYCEYWGETYNQWFSTSTMCRALQREQLTLKKRRYAARHFLGELFLQKDALLKQQQRESKSEDVNIGSKLRTLNPTT